MANESYLNALDGSGSRQLDALIPLAIERQLRVIRPEQDPFIGRFVSSAGVVRPSGPDGFSRDWILRKPVKGQLHGVAEMATTDTVFGPATEDLGLQFRIPSANLPTYPDGFKGPRDKGYNIEVELKGLRFSLGVALADHDVNALGSKIGDDILHLAEGGARQISEYFTSHFYAKDGDGTMATFTHLDANDDYTDPLGVYEVALDSGDNLNQFQRGQMVDIYEAGNTRVNETAGGERIEVYVRSVNHNTGKIKLEYRAAGLSGGLFAGDAALDDDETATIVLRGSYQDTFPGLNTFCKSTAITTATHPNYYDTSDAYFGFALEDYPEHDSLVKDLNGQFLTEMVGSRLISEFEQEKGRFGFYLDSAIIPYGVYDAYMQNRMQRVTETRDATNPGVLGGGSGGVNKVVAMTFGGRTVMGYLNNYMRKDQLFLLRRNNNFKMYAPPAPSDVQSGENPLPGDETGANAAMQVTSDMQALGFPSHRVPKRDGDGNVADGYQYHLRARSTLHPDAQFSMVKVENVGSLNEAIPNVV